MPAFRIASDLVLRMAHTSGDKRMVWAVSHFAVGQNKKLPFWGIKEVLINARYVK